VKHSSETYKNWNVDTLENEFIKIYVANELGGRVIQVEMRGYEFLFNNPNLYGQVPTAVTSGERNEWQNFGGEKIWPAPQGWDSPNEWPGPPDPVIDSGFYSMQYIQNTETLRLASEIDYYTGLRVERDIRLSDDHSEVVVNVSFANESEHTRTWAIWPVCQMNILEISSKNRYKIVSPLHPKSIFGKQGFKVIHGLVNNPQYKIASSGNLEVTYQYLVGKIGIDSKAGWVAFIDTHEGKVAILQFQPQRGQVHIDDTNIQIWTQGSGLVYSRNRVIEFESDEKANPPYMEVELLSSLQKIHPGHHLKFTYRMSITTIPCMETIIDVRQVGVIVNHLTARWVGQALNIKAKYGVFLKGTLRVYLKKTLQEEPSVILEKFVDPQNGIDIDFTIESTRSLKHKFCITVHLFNTSNNCIGELGKIETN
jgi:hypothetical protein